MWNRHGYDIHCMFFFGIVNGKSRSHSPKSLWSIVVLFTGNSTVSTVIESVSKWMIWNIISYTEKEIYGIVISLSKIHARLKAALTCNDFLLVIVISFEQSFVNFIRWPGTISSGRNFTCEIEQSCTWYHIELRMVCWLSLQRNSK